MMFRDLSVPFASIATESSFMREHTARSRHTGIWGHPRGAAPAYRAGGRASEKGAAGKRLTHHLTPSWSRRHWLVSRRPATISRELLLLLAPRAYGSLPCCPASPGLLWGWPFHLRPFPGPPWRPVSPWLTPTASDPCSSRAVPPRLAPRLCWSLHSLVPFHLFPFLGLGAASLVLLWMFFSNIFYFIYFSSYYYIIYLLLLFSICLFFWQPHTPSHGLFCPFHALFSSLPFPILHQPLRFFVTALQFLSFPFFSLLFSSTHWPSSILLCLPISLFPTTKTSFFISLPFYPVASTSSIALKRINSSILFAPWFFSLPRLFLILPSICVVYKRLHKTNCTIEQRKNKLNKHEGVRVCI